MYAIKIQNLSEIMKRGELFNNVFFFTFNSTDPTTNFHLFLWLALRLLVVCRWFEPIDYLFPRYRWSTLDNLLAFRYLYSMLRLVREVNRLTDHLFKNTWINELIGWKQNYDFGAKLRIRKWESKAIIFPIVW